MIQSPMHSAKRLSACLFGLVACTQVLCFASILSVEIASLVP